MKLPEWKVIPGFSRYEASCYGKIRRVSDKREMKFTNKCKGENHHPSFCVTLISDENKKVCMQALRAVAMAFFDIPEGKFVSHKNGIATDFSIWNVRFVSKEEQHKICGKQAKRNTVVKIDKDGNETVYPSARIAGEANFISRRAVTDHCNGTRKVLTDDSFTFYYEDNPHSKYNALKRIKNCK